ncbi:MAG: RsmD family RNA methyltransferase, partial [Campylobacter curvus]
GADRAIANEKDRAAFKLTTKNMASVDELNLRAINGDSFEILADIVNSQTKPVLLYLDPPFDMRDGFSGVYDALSKLIADLKKDKIFMIVFEHASSFKFSDKIANFTLLKSKKFGATTLSYFI